MICPNCGSEMDVQPFGNHGARRARCTDPGCKVYFVLPKNAKTEGTKVPEPKKPRTRPKPVPQQKELPNVVTTQEREPEPTSPYERWLAGKL